MGSGEIGCLERADSIGGVDKIWLWLERVVCLSGRGRPVGLVGLFVRMVGLVVGCKVGVKW